MQRPLEKRFFLLLLGVVTGAFFLMLGPFWGAIFWAIALAVLFYPIYHWLCQKLKEKRSLAAVLTLSLAVLIVVVPLTLITFQIVSQANDIYQSFDQGDIDGEVIQQYIEENLPIVPELMNRYDLNASDLGQRLSDTLSSSSQYIAQEAFKLGRSTFHFLVSMGVMLYLTFFFFRDGEKITQAVRNAIPLGEGREDKLSDRFVKVTRATFKSTFIVAAVEGILGWAILAILGIPGALFLGVLIGILSLVPALGSFLVWGPIAAYLLFSGEIMQGVILLIFGAVIIGLVDNILRPLLVGRDIRLPDWLILLSILGGLSIFGIHGFIIGPILTALFVTLWNIFSNDFESDDR
ncbi:AI-2E family transporter [Aliidiomarina sedimenti]|uniref:AI-2E family transporter n=1 Tax=Aliidiomarina sedimenti TaxID=1933879 RepID=A0ABY0C1G5_9GAMM|nr:AI-2E family transporter [Aliidiomarina sedimenti]RUO31584.1 AI-2E family transporter [Aliidiomarina sedimenti]